MALAIEARSVMRLLLTLLMLYSHIAAGQAPGSDSVGDTLMDDEDISLSGEGRSGVSFTVNMTSKVKLNQGCNDEKLKEDIKTHLRKNLITALGEDCKCPTSEVIIDKETLECMADPLVRYTGRISEWNSPMYTVEQVSKFIKSWRAEIEVAANGLVTFTFNVTSSQSEPINFGSGDGGPGVNEEFGSGDIATIEDIIPGDGDKDEEIKDVANVGGLSGELRSQVVGYTSVICTALAAALLLSFV